MTTRSPPLTLASPAANNEGDAAIVRFLESDPAFFERHPALLAKLRLPHTRGGATVSLVERQVEVLRERQATADRRLADFVAVARSNETLAARVHTLTCRLMRAPSLRDVCRELRASLEQDFDAHDARLILTGVTTPRLGDTPETFARVVAASEPALKSFETLFTSGKPRCGQARDVQRNFLFGDDADGVASVALLPLGDKGAIGLLAIASHDVQRFHPGMSTDFLTRIGDLVGEAIRRCS